MQGQATKRIPESHRHTNKNQQLQTPLANHFPRDTTPTPYPLLNLQPLKLLNTLLPVPALHFCCAQLLPLHLLHALADLLLPRIIHELPLLLDELVVLLEPILCLGNFFVNINAALDV
jgi:hypothetical protein